MEVSIVFCNIFSEMYQRKSIVAYFQGAYPIDKQSNTLEQ